MIPFPYPYQLEFAIATSGVMYVIAFFAMLAVWHGPQTPEMIWLAKYSLISSVLLFILGFYLICILLLMFIVFCVYLTVWFLWFSCNDDVKYNPPE